MSENLSDKKILNLLSNNRFWVLAFGVTLSLIIFGFVEQFVPSGSLREIRLQQIYGFISLGLIVFSLMISPLVKIFPKFRFNSYLQYIRRPLGVLAFYYALLHSSIAFFLNLGGVGGLKYLDSKFLVATIFAFIALFILFLLSITSTDWAVNKIGIRNWKKLHRLIYLGVILIIVHFFLIGTHFSRFTIYSVLTIGILLSLFALEFARIRKVQGKKKNNHVK